MWKKVSADRRIKKMQHTCDKVLLSMRRKETLTPVTTWMNLEDIMLSKISQTQKHRYCLISLIWNLKRKKKKRQIKER